MLLGIATPPLTAVNGQTVYRQLYREDGENNNVASGLLSLASILDCTDVEAGITGRAMQETARWGLLRGRRGKVGAKPISSFLLPGEEDAQRLGG